MVQVRPPKSVAPPNVVRIAIVGGGCAGMAAAWQLCQNNLQPEPSLLYDITVYEKSSMLGGKGSSYRDTQGRIRDHGLHIWLGFYENAFALMREAYREAGALGMGPQANDTNLRLPFGSFDDAFSAESHVGVASRGAKDQWEAWTGHLPPMPGLPGDPIDEKTNPFTLAAYLSRCVALSLALMNSVIGSPAEPDGGPNPEDRSAADETRDLAFADSDGIANMLPLERMAHWLEKGLLTTAAGIVQGAAIVETWLREFSPLPQFDSTVLKYLEVLATQVRRRLRKFVAADADLRRKTEVIDLIMTIVVGLYRDRVLFDQTRGLDAIDDIDCKTWLLKHGALRTSVESPFVTGLYDLAFCYKDGNRATPALAAGQALRGALRMFFSYRGSIFWRMRAGMGETVFSPLYRVLASGERWLLGGSQATPNPYPVKFAFMHRLERIDSVQEGDALPRISALTFKVEGRVVKALDDYGCWPEPNVPANAPRTLKLRCRTARTGSSNGFDGVVFALGIDDFRNVVAANSSCVLHTDPAWKMMFANLKTVGTQAAQVWLTAGLPSLGWTRGPVLMSGYEVPLETWAEMSQTLPSERQWLAARAIDGAAPSDGVQSVVYFCGVLPDKVIGAAGKFSASKDARLRQHVRANLRQMLAGGMKPFWPRAYDKGRTPLDCMVGDLANQHWQANWYGSARYTLALPGTSRFRISPLERLVANMTIAGDWTACGFNEGCVEAAVMSGMLAAHAIAGKPELGDIVGYDHP